MKKEFYWLKLKNNFFDNDLIDYILNLQNGSDYILILQMLLLKTINQNGILASKINNVFIAYDYQKITRICKYFDIERIKEAIYIFETYKIIEKDKETDCFKFINFNEFIGKETNWAIYKRTQRNKIKVEVKENETL